MSLRTRQIFDFGNFRLDTFEKVLTRDGINVPLTPKVFATLQVLIESAGHLVEKDELMHRIWEDRFVEENNLTFNIKMLRKALGDDAGRPRFIETVPRRGYRFIAETRQVFIENDEAANGLDIQQLIDDPPSRASFLRNNGIPRVLRVGLPVLLFVGAAWYLAVGTNGREDLAPIFSNPSRSESLSFSGSIYQPRISPDGKYIAYITLESKTQSIWLRELSTGTHFPLLNSSTDDYAGLMFSSKSDFVYFVRKPNEGTQAQAAIYRISIFGGIPTPIVADVQGWFSISPIDDQIAFVRYEANRKSGLWIADSDGQGVRRIAVREAPHYFRANRWSPDGQTVAVAVGQADSGANDFGLIEITIEQGEERELVAHRFLEIADLEWLPERSGLLFAARENSSPNNQIWRVSLENGEIAKVVDDGASYVSLSLDKGATQMAVSHSIPDFRISVASFADPGRSITTGTAMTISTFTPGGKVVYAAVKGQVDIWMMNADGTQQTQLTNHPLEDVFPLVSRDEKYIFFTSTRSGKRHIWRMNLDGSDQVQITKNTGGMPIFLSPDGETLYYLSAANRNLWKVPFNGGTESLFFDARVLCPAFSPDGKYFAYFERNLQFQNSYDIKVVVTANMTEAISLDQAERSAVPVQIAWAPDGRSFYYASTVRSTTTVWRQSISNRIPEKIAEIGDHETVVDFAVAPDGQKFSYVGGAWKREAKLVKGLR